MSPLLPLDTWSTRSRSTLRKPKSKCFLVAEGANTEFWYLEALANRLAREGRPELVELKPVERTGDERNQSSPHRPAEQAAEIAEVFLLLHAYDAYEKVLLPNMEAILANGYAGGHRRFADKLASEVLGLNVKSNPAVGDLSARFEDAVKEERNLNRDPAHAIGTLTSNVGAVLSGIVEDGSRHSGSEG